VCALYFLEIFNWNIGKNNLLKQSILLIRAWWFHVTDTYTISSVHEYIDEFTLLIMVCAIFNQFHNNIETPMQALYFFFSEYAKYDGSSQVITFHGIFDVTKSASNPPPYVKIPDSCLLTYEMVEKWKAIFAPNGIAAPDSSKLSMAGFNVIHPFTLENLVSAKLSSNRASKIQKCVLVGLSSLSKLIVRFLADPTEATARAGVNDFFSTLKSKFVDNDIRLDRGLSKDPALR
jgi:hypothetical protein